MELLAKERATGLNESEFLLLLSSTSVVMVELAICLAEAGVTIDGARLNDDDTDTLELSCPE